MVRLDVGYQLGPGNIVNEGRKGGLMRSGERTDYVLPAVYIARCGTTFCLQARKVDIFTEEIAIYIMK